MPLPVRLISSGNEARITSEGELVVSAVPDPGESNNKIRPFRQYLTTDGTAGGTNDMGVDGSTTNVDYYVQARNDADRYITNMSIIVGYGTTGQPFQWADGTALTNGTRLFYETTLGEIDIHEGITNNQDMFRLSHEAVRADWEVRGVQANNDYGYFIIIDFDSYLPPYGALLAKGTTQRLVMQIRDNAGTAADTFNAIAYGFDRF